MPSMSQTKDDEQHLDDSIQLVKTKLTAKHEDRLSTQKVEDDDSKIKAHAKSAQIELENENMSFRPSHQGFVSFDSDGIMTNDGLNYDMPNEVKSSNISPCDVHRGSKQACPPVQKKKQDNETKKSNSYANASQDPNSETNSNKPEDHSPSINSTLGIPPSWSDNTVVHVAVATPVPTPVSLNGKSRPRSIANSEDVIEEMPRKNCCTDTKIFVISSLSILIIGGLLSVSLFKYCIFCQKVDAAQTTTQFKDLNSSEPSTQQPSDQKQLVNNNTLTPTAFPIINESILSVMPTLLPDIPHHKSSPPSITYEQKMPTDQPTFEYISTPHHPSLPPSITYEQKIPTNQPTFEYVNTRLCKNWCENNPNPWTADAGVVQKCSFDGCAGCPVCVETRKSYPCENWCKNNENPWIAETGVSQKCNWKENCAGCKECF